MASLINSIRNITSDPWWFVKIGIFSGVLFYILDQGYHIPQVMSDQNIMSMVISLFFVFTGIAAVSMYRNINNLSPFFPGLTSIFEILIKGIFVTIAMFPGLLISYFLYNYLITIEFENLTVTIIIYVIAASIMSPFIFIPAVLACVRGNLLDALKLDIVFKGAGNYIVQFLSYLIQYAIIVGAVTLVLYYFLVEMLGDHWSLLFLKSIVIVITFFSIFSYSSDLYGDAIPQINFEEKTNAKREKKEEKIEKHTHSAHDARLKRRNRPNR